MNKKLLFAILGIFVALAIALLVSVSIFQDTSTQDEPIPLQVVDSERENVLLQNPRYTNGDLDAIFDDETEPEVLDFQLKSHPSVDYVKQVGVGNQVVMFYDVNSVYQLENALQDPEFIDMRTGELVEREWKYVVWGNESYESPVYSETTSENGTTILEQTGTETKTREAWLDYNSRDLKKGKQRIGIEVEVKLNDHIDGVWVVGGKRIDRHAQWEASLDDARSWWRLNETSGTTTIDATGNHSGTLSGVTIGEPGANPDITNNSYNWTADTDEVDFGDTAFWFNGSDPFTIGMWWKPHVPEDNTDRHLFSRIQGSSPFEGYDLAYRHRAATKQFQFDARGSTGIYTAQFEYAVNNTEWIFLIFTFDGSSDARIYINNTEITRTGSSGTFTGVSPSVNAFLGNRDSLNQGIRGSIDEAFIYERVITSAERDTLWNDGNGCTYQECEGLLTVTLLSPENNTQFTTNDVDFSANVTNSSANPTISNVTIEVFNTNGTLAYNNTNTSGISGTYNWNNITLPDADYNWTVYAYGNDSIQYNATNGTLFFTIDLVEPTVTLLYPENDSQVNDEPVTFIAGLTSGNYTYLNATLDVWYSNGTSFNSTSNTSINGATADQNVTFDMLFDPETYIWNVELNYNNTDLSTINSVSATNNFTFEWVAFEVNNESFNEETFETKNETFYINITTNDDVSNIGAFLRYNGTSYAATHTCSSGFCQINRTIDIPLISDQTADSENKTFNWRITVFGTFGTFTTDTDTNQQNVSNIDFTTNSTGNAEAVKFDIYNETDAQQILADFDGAFNYYLGSGTVFEQTNASLSGANTYSFYINHNETFYVNSTIDIENGTRERGYFFLRENYTNDTTTKNLFIPNGDTSNIIIEVKDQGLIPLEGYLVQIYRFYPAENMYREIGSRITDEFGTIVEKLVENDVEYKFEFYDNSKTLQKTSDKISVACRSSICILPFVIEEDEDNFERFENLTLFDYEFTFNNNTNTFIFNWDDQRQESHTINLEVIRYQLNQSETVCDKSSTSTVSSLNCVVGSDRASYRATVSRTLDGDTRRIALLNIQVGNPFDTFGVEGLLWVFILLMTTIGIGAFNPSVGAILYGVGFVFMGIVGIISMPLPVFFANTLLVILFIWAVKV